MTASYSSQMTPRPKMTTLKHPLLLASTLKLGLKTTQLPLPAIKSGHHFSPTTSLKTLRVSAVKACFKKLNRRAKNKLKKIAKLAS